MNRVATLFSLSSVNCIGSQVLWIAAKLKCGPPPGGQECYVNTTVQDITIIDVTDRLRLQSTPGGVYRLKSIVSGSSQPLKPLIREEMC